MELKKKDLIILLDLLKTRSFTLSAINLGISQASLSKSIAGLENKFGVSLLDRTIRPVTPTLFCVELIPFIEGIVNSYNDLELHVQIHKKKPSGLVNIYCPVPFQVVILHKIIPLIMKDHPDIKLSIKTIRNDINDKLLGALFLDDCDILISFFKPRNENLISRKLAEVKYNVYGIASDALNNKAVTLKNIRERDFILHTSFQNKSGTNDLLLHINNVDETITVSGKIICDNIYSMMSLMSKGIGLGYLPEVIASKNLSLKRVLPQEYSSKLNVFINYPRKDTIPLRNSIVIDSMVKYFESFDMDNYMSTYTNQF